MNHPSTSERPLPPTARGQRTRQQLLDAAEAVFGEKGFDRSSIADITQGAKVALGTFYVYFTSKEAIFTELVEELGSRLRREIAASVEGLSNRLEIERAGFRTFFAFAREHRNLYRIIHQAEFIDEEAFRRYYRKMAEGYTAGLSRMMQAGQIRSMDAECLAYCLMGIADFVGMRWAVWESDDQLEKALETVITFVSLGMAMPPARARPQRSRGKNK